MKNKKKHLQREERFFIDKTLKTGKSIGFIARLLERGVSTISLEVSRNGGREGYNSNLAQNRAIGRQANKKLGSYKLARNNKLKTYVTEKLKDGMSPELISKALKRRNIKNFYVSPKGIRKYINTKR